MDEKREEKVRNLKCEAKVLFCLSALLLICTNRGKAFTLAGYESVRLRPALQALSDAVTNNSDNLNSLKIIVDSFSAFVPDLVAIGFETDDPETAIAEAAAMVGGLADCWRNESEPSDNELLILGDFVGLALLDEAELPLTAKLDVVSRRSRSPFEVAWKEIARKCRGNGRSLGEAMRDSEIGKSAPIIAAMFAEGERTHDAIPVSRCAANYLKFKILGIYPPRAWG